MGGIDTILFVVIAEHTAIKWQMEATLEEKRGTGKISYNSRVCTTNNIINTVLNSQQTRLQNQLRQVNTW